MTSLLDAAPDPLLTLEPARQATLRELFDIDSDMTVPAFAERDSHVPDIASTPRRPWPSAPASPTTAG